MEKFRNHLIVKNIRMAAFRPYYIGAVCLFVLLYFLPGIFFGRSSELHSQEVSVSRVENLGIPNWSGYDFSPVISPDGKYLVFQSDRPGSSNKSNLWFTVNKNYRDTGGDAEWTPPLPLRFPFLEDATQTMKSVRPQGTVADPDGAFTVNTDGFEGMFSILYLKDKPIEIYFTGVRGDEASLDGYDNLNIYFSRYRDRRWSSPRHLNILNSNFDDKMPSISADGQHLYFASDRPGGFGGFDIWYSFRDLKTGQWSNPVNAGSSVNSEFNEISPVVSAGGMLFFSSDRPGGFGNYDIYVSHEFSAALNLGYPFNSSRDDEYFSMTQDGLWAYFSSDRNDPLASGGMDLYRASVPEALRSVVRIAFTGLILDGSTRQPLGLEATIAIQYENETIIETSSIFQKDPGNEIVNNFKAELLGGREYKVTVSAPGFYPVELTLNYKGNIPADKTDRRVIVLSPVEKEDTSLRDFRNIPGRVIDDRTGLSLPGSSVIYAYEDSANMEAIVDQEGRFSVRVRRGREFKITGEAPGYQKSFQTFLEKSELKEIVIRLRPGSGKILCPGDAPACIDNLRIYFDLNASGIRNDQKEVLEAIAKILKKNPALKVEIQGNTDRTYMGPQKNAFAYNKRLSEMRARSVFEALKKLGVPENILSIRGYSYTNPREKGDNPKTRALNRRVEFRRIRK